MRRVVVPDPPRTRHEVLREHRDRDDEARNEAAAWLVMPAKKEVRRDHQGDGNEQTRDDGWNQHVPPRHRVGARFHEIGGDILRHDALLIGRFEHLDRRSKPAQQGIDGEGDDAEHRDFAEGV